MRLAISKKSIIFNYVHYEAVASRPFVWNPVRSKEFAGFFYAQISGHPTMKHARLSGPDICFHGSRGQGSRGFTGWTLWNQIGMVADRPVCKIEINPAACKNSNQSGLIAGNASNIFNAEKQPIACQGNLLQQAEKTGVPFLFSSAVALV